jgi:hypothetical protein
MVTIFRTACPSAQYRTRAGFSSGPEALIPYSRV